MTSTIMEFFEPTLVRRVQQSQDTNIGSAQNSSQNSNSASSLLSTLVPTFLLFVVFTTLFLLLRTREQRQYAPRTFLGNLLLHERTPSLPRGLLGWFKAFFSMPDTYVLQHNSLDGYFLLRYLKIATAICFVGCCITWPVLFPINATGGAGQKQLDMLNFSNVTGNKYRYLAHTGVAWIFIGFVFFMVTRESIYYINLRQAYLLSPMYASRISSRTVLFTSVPGDYLNEAKIRRMFGAQLKNLWIPTDTKEIEDKVKQRDKTAMKLEGAEIKLIKLANAARLKSMKKGGANNAEHGGFENTRDNGHTESGSAAARWIKPKQRPTHRLGFLGLFGKKVDSINWCRSELERTIPEVDALQHKHRAGEINFVASVFVEFFTQTEAQAAYQMVAHHQALHMSPRYIGFSPQEVVWSNLRIKWWERVMRNNFTIAAVILTIVFWSIPVAVVGAISNIQALTNKVHFLKFILDIPPVILGVVTGLLPSILLAVLMALLPIYLRFMSKAGGLATLSRIELRTQNFYFWFQVIQVFLVATIASAASAAVTKIIANPSSATSLLATNLPKASNFYISYFILQGLTFSSGALLQIVGLIIFRVLGKILDKSPRKMYKRWSTLSAIGWGTIFPVVSNLTVIAITYSCIAPLVLGFATVGLYLFYLAFRYNLLFVNTGRVDTKGLVYPRALQHTLTGCYLSIICLIGLFAIKTAILALVLMIVFGIFCVLYHIALLSAINPLLQYLPRSLEAEEDALLASVENGHGANRTHGTNGTGAVNGVHDDVTVEKGLQTALTQQAPPHKKPSMFAKFLGPHKYTDYATMRRLVPQDFGDIVYDPETERNAYYHPAISSTPPLLWIPRDQAGVAREEIRHTNHIIPISDEGAYFDEKNKIVWDHNYEGGRPPIYQEKVYY